MRVVLLRRGKQLLLLLFLLCGVWLGAIVMHGKLPGHPVVYWKSYGELVN